MSSHPINSNDTRPWYKEFWAWFVLTPLIVVVIVSTITVSIAVRYADDRVLDDYYKEGRMINTRLDQDLLAKDLQLSAKLVFDQELGELGLELLSELETYPDELRLELSHPARAELDQVLRLRRLGFNRYQTELTNSALLNRWYLRLQPKASTKSSDSEVLLWRLRGEINFSQNSSVVLSADG